MPGSQLSWCCWVPSCSTAEPNRPHCTPDLICRLGSAVTSSSKPAMLAPLSSSPPVRLRERAVHAAVLDQQMQLAEHALAVLGHAEPLDPAERRVLQHLAGLATGAGPRAEQHVGDRGDVDARIGCLGSGVRCGRCTAGGRALARCGLLRTDGGISHGVTSGSEGEGSTLPTVGLPQRPFKPVGAPPQGGHDTGRAAVVRTPHWTVRHPMCFTPQTAVMAGSFGSEWRDARPATTMEPRGGRDGRDARAVGSRRPRGARARQHRRR